LQPQQQQQGLRGHGPGSAARADGIGIMQHHPAGRARMRLWISTKNRTPRHLMPSYATDSTEVPSILFAADQRLLH
jgi:hypothetical protein